MPKSTTPENRYKNREVESSYVDMPYGRPPNGTERFPHEVPWEFLFRLAGRPRDSDYREVRAVEGEATVALLRELPDHRIASGYELARMLGARYGLEGGRLWERYWEADKQGYINDVGDVVILPEKMPEAPEMDATKW